MTYKNIIEFEIQQNNLLNVSKGDKIVTDYVNQ